LHDSVGITTIRISRLNPILRVTSKKMKMDRGNAYATRKFRSFGFDKYPYHSVEEAESMMAIGVFRRSFQLVLKGLPAGQSPLHAMCLGNKPAIAQLLIQQEGAGVNIVDSNGQTPLHMAAQKGHTEVVTVLLAHEGIRLVVGALSAGEAGR
jgi:hypothetical protein